MASADRRPFGQRFLHAVLAEIALAGREQGLDLLGGASLGDGDQGYASRVAPRELADGTNAVSDFS